MCKHIVNTMIYNRKNSEKITELSWRAYNFYEKLLNNKSSILNIQTYPCKILARVTIAWTTTRSNVI